MLAMIDLGATFKDNLQLLPPIDHLARIDLVNMQGTVIAIIENQPGKQGSVAVYNYLAQLYGHLDAKAAAHGLLVFAEHTMDACNRPGAHPNIDRLLEIEAGESPLAIQPVTADR